MKYTLSVASKKVNNYEAQLKSKKLRYKEVSLSFLELEAAIKTLNHTWRVFEGGERLSSKAVKVTAIILDIDDKTTFEEFKKSRLKKYNYIAYASRNHKLDKGKDKGGIQERFHIAFLTSEPLTDMDKATSLQKGLIDLALSYNLEVDKAAKDLARNFQPSCKNLTLEENPNFFITTNKTKKFINEDYDKVASLNLTQDIKREFKEVDGTILEDCVRFLEIYNSEIGLTEFEWYRLGASLSNTENGREYFAQISSAYHAGATEVEIESKWNTCQKSTQINIASFFHFAKTKGWQIPISTQNKGIDPIQKPSQYLQKKIEDTLQNDIEYITERHRDQFLKSIVEEDITRKPYEPKVEPDLYRLFIHGRKVYMMMTSLEHEKYTLETCEVDLDWMLTDTVEFSNEKDKREKLKSMKAYLNTNRYFFKLPTLKFITGLTEQVLEKLKKQNRSTRNKILNKFLENKEFIQRKYSPKTGVIEVIQPLRHGDMYDKTKADWLNDLLTHIYDRGKTKDLHLIKKLMAQAAFEHRTKGKPTLIQFGARGTAKSLFDEHIMTSLYYDCRRKYDPQGDFSYHNEATKVINLAEANGRNKKKTDLYDFVKEHSGSSSNEIKRKQKDPISRDATAYWCISFNKVGGFYVGDDDETNKQFIAIEFDQEQNLDNDPIWKKLNPSVPKIKESIKAFTYYYLKDVYLDMMEDDYYDSRYGFNTVANKEALTKLQEFATSKNTEIVDSVVETLKDVCYGSIGFRNRLREFINYGLGKPIDIDLAIYFAKEGFLMTTFLEAIFKFTGEKHLKLATLINFLRSKNIEVEIARKNTPKHFNDGKRTKVRGYKAEGWETIFDIDGESDFDLTVTDFKEDELPF